METNFKTNEPLPEGLRKSLNIILNGKDLAKISSKDEGMVSVNTIRNILDGWKINNNSISTVTEMIRYAICKCNEQVVHFEKQKSIIAMYNKKPVEVL